jgi:hypothetical protein
MVIKLGQYFTYTHLKFPWPFREVTWQNSAATEFYISDSCNETRLPLTWSTYANALLSFKTLLCKYTVFVTISLWANVTSATHLESDPTFANSLPVSWVCSQPTTNSFSRVIGISQIQKQKLRVSLRRDGPKPKREIPRQSLPPFPPLSRLAFNPQTRISDHCWAMLALALSPPFREVGAAPGIRSKIGKYSSPSPPGRQGKAVVSQPCGVQNTLESSGTTSRKPGPWPTTLPPCCCHAAADIPW